MISQNNKIIINAKTQTQEPKDSPEDNDLNKYDILSEFHPTSKDFVNELSEKYYWKLGQFMPKDILLRKASDNCKLAISLQDTEYLLFLQTFLNKEGYEIELRQEDSLLLQELEKCIMEKPKAKINITLKRPITNTKSTNFDLRSNQMGNFSRYEKNPDELNTHSKNKSKKHEQALAIKKQLESQQEGIVVNDLLFLDAIKQIGYKMTTTSLTGLPDPGMGHVTGRFINASALRRVIIIYISQKDLQVGAPNFRLDDRLKDILASPDNLVSYFDLKDIIGRRLLQLSSDISLPTGKENPEVHGTPSVPYELGSPNSHHPHEITEIAETNGIKRIPIKLGKKTII
jgi:hypothetical protein